MIAPPGQMMHEISKAHRAWAGSVMPDAVPSVPMDETLVAALDAARRGDDVFAVAKMIRSVFNRLEWPNEDHPGTQADFHKEHNIPTIDLPGHATPDDARVFVAARLAEIKAQGWGTPQWEIT